MSLLHRKPKPLAPEEKTFRDDVLIVVVTEDTFAPEQYFNLIKARRVQVKVAPSQGGHSSPQAILASARVLKKDPDFQDFDEFWLLLDTDHWFERNHIANCMTVISEAKSEGFQVAVSNPCFDLWLLLHHDDVPPDRPFENCQSLEQRFRELKGKFNKTKLELEHFNVDLALVAIDRGKRLTPDTINFRPKNPGTQVWALVERALRDVIGKSGRIPAVR